MLINREITCDTAMKEHLRHPLPLLWKVRVAIRVAETEVKCPTPTAIRPFQNFELRHRPLNTTWM